MVWFCSDWHFNHDKEFIWKDRGFNSVNEMNEEIVKRHNSVVAEDDDVYVLGDLCMSENIEANKAFIERLNGNIHIVLGNHDTPKRIKMYESCKNVFVLLYSKCDMKFFEYTLYTYVLTTNP